MTKEEIKAWLKVIKQNKFWLAEQLGVSVNTVNGWLYGIRPIPARTEKLLALLMREHPAGDAASAPPPEVPENVLVLHATGEEFRAWNSAALASGQLVAEWAAQVLNDAAGSVQE